MESPNTLYALALASFLPIVVALAVWLEPRRAVLIGLLGGWLFLPHFDVYGAKIPLFHDKAGFVPGIVALVSLVLDSRRWSGLRLRLFDLPILGYCVAQLGASVSNALGAYDALSALVEASATWLSPYLLGRVYFGDGKGLRDLANALVAAGLVYAPLALWEVRMSPQLHREVYGYIQSGFIQHIRAGGFRPLLFMEHGLMVAMFFSTATLIAYWHWRTRSTSAVLRLSPGWAVVILAFTTASCKSAASIILLCVGVGVLESARRWRSAALVVVLALSPIAYSGARLAGWSGGGLTELAEKYLGPERSQSLRFRMDNEDILVAKALQRPWIGWSRWNRSRVFDENGKDISVTDGLWIIVLGVSGFSGLVLLTLALSPPALAVARRLPPGGWGDASAAPVAAMAVALAMWTVDCQLNAMLTPIFPMIAGALGSAVAAAGVQPRSRQRLAIPPYRPRAFAPPAHGTPT